MSRILIAEDDAEIAMLERDYLEIEGFETELVEDGEQAAAAALTGRYDLILLDLMLPGCDGYEVCRRIRDRVDVPILMVTARTESVDKIRGLGLGADDYIAKPFHPQELVARVRSQLRRYTQLGDVNAQSQGGEIVNGRLCYRPEERVLLVDGEPVKLTATELKIVDLLMRNLGRVFPAEEIYRRVWNEEAYATENTVMVHIRRIREKIELNPKEPEYLKVVWGIGYKIEKR